MYERERYLFVTYEMNISDPKKLRDENQMVVINVMQTILQVNQEKWKLLFLQMYVWEFYNKSVPFFSVLWNLAYFFVRMKHKQTKTQTKLNSVVSS